MMYEYNRGFLVSWYGDECVIDVVRDISTISIYDIVNAIRYREIRVITVLYNDKVLTEYHCKYDCFAFRNKNISERKWSYELRNLYKRYKKTKPKNSASC